MTARVQYALTGCGLVMLAGHITPARLPAHGRRVDFEITPAGLAAMRAFELARPPARGAVGRSPTPPRVQLAAARPERPAAAADFSGE